MIVHVLNFTKMRNHFRNTLHYAVSDNFILRDTSLEKETKNSSNKTGSSVVKSVVPVVIVASFVGFLNGCGSSELDDAGIGIKKTHLSHS